MTIERTKEKGKSGEKKTIELKVRVGGKQRRAILSKGIRLHDAIKELQIDNLSQYTIVRLNGRQLKQDDEGEWENPKLEEDSMLVLAEKIKGGLWAK